ncbi:hypothetical protein J2Z79_002617 [Symbiobacterium terraclitae]|uniref:Spore coat protein n=1 Tax=Symbiobacterium terraclitae TaxID=557451 RepID=A0ABS4JUG1_9FIRM|nr:hypothetical protein [Symbiobacterium terraclitae]MBP2019192.1 hypothetical protein [Symbiobacterium terraclitae]
MQFQTGTMTPLTEKDLAYLHDMMSWELLAAKKAFRYANETQEPECRQAMFQVAEQHQRNLERLVLHLKQHVDQATQITVSGADQPATVM